MLTVIQDKDPIFITGDYEVVLLGTSIYGLLQEGFQRKMKFKYPYIDEANIKQPYGDMRRLGTRLTIQRDNDPCISLLYISARSGKHKYVLDKDALAHALQTANKEFAGKKVLTTVMGVNTWDGRGNREEVIEIIKNNTQDLNLFLYDFVEMLHGTEIHKCRRLQGEWKREFYERLRKEFYL